MTSRVECMECPVCYDHEATCKYICGHSFCMSCTQSWFRKGSSTCPMCRVTMCFKGMLKQRRLWELESIQEIYVDFMSDLIDCFEEEFSQEFMVCLSVIQERFNYTLKKYPKVTKDEMDVILHFSWIPIEHLMNEKQLIYEPKPFNKYMFIGGDEYSVKVSKSYGSLSKKI